MSESITNATAKMKWDERAEAMESRSRLPDIAQALLLLIGVIALVFTSVSVSNYLGSAQSRSQLHLEMTDLQIIDDDDPRAIIHHKLHNLSPLPVQVERYFFFLYLNEELVGASHSVYFGTNPDTDSKIYSKARAINQPLDSQQSLDLEFTLFIYPTHMEMVRQAQDSGDAMTWSTRADFRVLLPYTHDEDNIRLYATIEEDEHG